MDNSPWCTIALGYNTLPTVKMINNDGACALSDIYIRLSVCKYCQLDPRLTVNIYCRQQ